MTVRGEPPDRFGRCADDGAAEAAADEESHLRWGPDVRRGRDRAHGSGESGHKCEGGSSCISFSLPASRERELCVWGCAGTEVAHHSQVLQFKEMIVEQAMTPWGDVFCLEVCAYVQTVAMAVPFPCMPEPPACPQANQELDFECLASIFQSGHSRVPIFEARTFLLRIHCFEGCSSSSTGLSHGALCAGVQEQAAGRWAAVHEGSCAAQS